ESADPLAQRAHERLALPQAVDGLEPVDVLEVVAGIQVREDGARLLPRGERDLDDVVDALAPLLPDPDVDAGWAELATARRGHRPVEARVRDVHAEVVALEHAHSPHRNALGGRARVPSRLRRKPHRVNVAIAVVEDAVAILLPCQPEG